MGYSYGNRPGARIPSMEQRHFFFMADTLAMGLRQARVSEHATTIYLRSIKQFADGCAASNAKFNRSKFYEQCGVTRQDETFMGWRL